MNDYNNKLAYRLEIAIKRSGLSYARLEELTGISHSAINRYANGKVEKLPIERMKKIAEATGVSVRWLMGWEDEKRNP